MTHLQRILLTLAIIFISLSLGYLCRKLAEKGHFPLNSRQLDILRRKLQTVSIFGLLPFSAMLSLWGLPNPAPALLALPLLGLVSYIWGGSVAILAARFLRLDRQQTGSFYCCGTFTNIGAVGGLVCLLFLGENSIALVALYRLIEEIYYFSVSFPIARWYGEKKSGSLPGFRDFRFDPILAVIVCALLLGISLNIAGVPRPEIFGFFASATMLVATVFFLFAIGLTLRPSSVASYWPQSLVMCGIKFAGIPIVVTALAKGIGYGGIEGGLPLKVVCILSAMPVAMTALVPPSLFNLDVDLANACWIFTTLGLVLILPVLMFILPVL